MDIEKNISTTIDGGLHVVQLNGERRVRLDARCTKERKECGKRNMASK